jgi:ribosomal protein L29
MAKKKEPLTSLSNTALLQKLEEARSSLVDLRFKKAGSQLKNPHELSIVRKDIARILTTLNMKHEA